MRVNIILFVEPESKRLDLAAGGRMCRLAEVLRVILNSILILMSHVNVALMRRCYRDLYSSWKASARYNSHVTQG